MPKTYRPRLLTLLLTSSLAAMAMHAAAEPFTISPPQELIFDGNSVSEGTFTLYTVFELDTNTNGPDPVNLCPACVGPDFPAHQATIGAAGGTHVVTELNDQTMPVIILVYGFDPGPPGDSSDQFITVVYTPTLDQLPLLLPTSTTAPAVTSLGSFESLLPQEIHGLPARFQVVGLDGSTALAGSVAALGPATFGNGPVFDLGTGIDGEPILGFFADASQVLGPGDSQPHGVTNDVPEPHCLCLAIVSVGVFLSWRRSSSAPTALGLAT